MKMSNGFTKSRQPFKAAWQLIITWRRQIQCEAKPNQAEPNRTHRHRFQIIKYVQHVASQGLASKQRICFALLFWFGQR